MGYNVASGWGVPQHYYPSNKVHKPKDPSYWATAISDNGLKLENMDNPAKYVRSVSPLDALHLVWLYVMGGPPSVAPLSMTRNHDHVCFPSAEISYDVGCVAIDMNLRYLRL